MKARNFKSFIEESLDCEIILLREILSNFLCEEQVLHKENHTSLQRVLLERSKLISELFLLRSKYMHTISKRFSQSTQHLPPLVQWLSPTDPDNLLLISMQEQIIAILERINQQNSRNATLFSEKKSRKRIAPSVNQKKEVKKVLTKTKVQSKHAKPPWNPPSP